MPSGPNLSCSSDNDQGLTDTTTLEHSESSNSSGESFMESATDESDWNDCGVGIHPGIRESKPQETTLPQTPFVYEGARPAADAITRKNIILFGETGVGKSSVINLMAGAEVAQTSSSLEGCTMAATEHSFTLPEGPSICIYDTVGLNEPEMGVNSFFGAIEKAHKLVRSLHHAGGIDLLVFCIRGGRITATVQRNYCLFAEFLCGNKVPLAFVVTHLEYEDEMENWWRTNESTLGKYDIRSVAHACITAAPARVTALAMKRADSQGALLKMLQSSLDSASSAYVIDVRRWVARIVEVLRSFLPESWRKWGLLRRLKYRCALSPAEAQQLAEMLTRGG